MTSTSPSQSNSIPSIKDLASSNATLRRQNLALILTHLQERPSTPSLTLQQSLAVWRGFSVALYMHDSKNALSVQKLISTLAQTIETMHKKDLEAQEARISDESNGLAVKERWQWTKIWSQAFWETVSKEWSGIDQWRMNKYLLLVRLVLRAVFESIAEVGVIEEEVKVTTTTPRSKKSSASEKPKVGNKRKHDDVESGDEASSDKVAGKSKTDDDLMSTQASMLEEWPLSATNRKVSDGLRLHVLDVWNDEITKSGLKDEVIAKLMQPVRVVAKGGGGISPSVKRKAREVLKEHDGEE